MTSRASHASSWSPSDSAVARARSASGSAASGWPWPSADWAATVSTRALRSSSAASAAHARARARCSSAMSQTHAVTAARATPRCAFVRRVAGPSITRSWWATREPTTIAWSVFPASARTSAATSSTSASRAASVVAVLARSRICSAEPSAPAASDRRASSSSRAAARSCCPDLSARPAATSHHWPGSAGCAASTASRTARETSPRSAGSRSSSTASRVSACRKRNCAPGSATSSCASTPARSAAITSRSDTCAAAGSSVQSKRRPRTAATCSTRAGSGPSPRSRPRTLSTKLTGNEGPASVSNDHRSPSHASAPAPTAPASTSSTMNGSPSDQARTYSTTPLGTSSEPRQAAVIRPRSSVASASSSRTVAVRAAIRPCSRRNAALASSDRTVATHSTGWVRSASTRYSSTASVSWSAQWRSSSTSSTADSPATAVRSRTTPSASTTGGSWVVSPGVRHSGSSLPRAGRNGDSPGRSGSPWLRKWDSRASENGRNGTGTSACTPRPKRTCTPDSRAAVTISPTSRDLPTPASPLTKTTPPAPRWASASAVRAVSST